MAELGPFFWIALTVFGSGLVLVGAANQHRWGVILAVCGAVMLAFDQWSGLATWTHDQSNHALAGVAAVLVIAPLLGIALRWAFAGAPEETPKRGRAPAADDHAQPSKLALVVEPRGPYVMDDFHPSVGSYRRVGIKNLTDEDIDGVEVFLDSFTPQGADFLPIHLIMMHGVTQPFTLTAWQERHVDVAAYSALSDATHIALQYRAPNQIPAEKAPYTLTLRATARGSRPCVETFTLDIDREDAKLILRPTADAKHQEPQPAPPTLPGRTPSLELALEGAEHSRSPAGVLASRGHVQVRNISAATTVRGIKVILETLEPVRQRFEICGPFELHAGEVRRVLFISFPGDFDAKRLVGFQLGDGSYLSAIDGAKPITESATDITIQYHAMLRVVASDTRPVTLECSFGLRKRGNDFELAFQVHASAIGRG